MDYQTKKQNSSMVRILLVNLIGVLTISLFFFLVMSNSSKNALTDAEDIARTQALNTARQIGDVYSGYRKMCDILASSQELADYTLLPSGSSDDVITQYGAALRKEMNSLESIYGRSINTVAAYFPDSHTMVTSARWVNTEQLNTFFDAYTLLSPDMFSTQPDGNTWLLGFDGLENGRSWIVRSVRLYRSAVYIIIDYDLRELISSYTAQDIAVMLGDGERCGYSSGEILDQPAFEEVLTDVETKDRFSLGGQSYAAARCEVWQMNINVLAGVSIERISRTSVALQIVMVLTIVFFAMNLFMLTLYLNKKVFRPLEYLRTKVDGTEDPQNMLYSVAENMTSLKADNEQMLREIEDILPLAMGRLLNRLYEERDTEHAVMLARSCLLMARVQQNHDFVLFAVSCVMDGSGFLQKGDSNQSPYRYQGMFYFVLENVLKDLLFEQYPGIAVPVNQNLYLVTVSCEQSTDMQAIDSILTQLIGFFDEAFDTVIVCTTPLRGRSDGDYAASVNATLSEASYMEFWQRRRRSDEKRMGEASFTYYCRQVKKLINRLNVLDYEGSDEILDYILENAIPDDLGSLNRAKGRVYAITTIMFTILDEQLGKDGEYTEPLTDIEERLGEVHTISAIKDELSRVLRECLNRSPAGGDTSSMENLVRVREFVEKNYTESSLNVNYLASHFGISSSYLSHSFKQAYGVNVSEYIQRLRVDAAKKLLPTNTVKAVAQQVGFWDTQGLVRAFKKYEGVNPSEYKKLMEEGNSLN